MQNTDNNDDIIRTYFRELQKKSCKTQFGSMTPEERSEHFRALSKKRKRHGRQKLSPGGELPIDK